MSPTFAQQASIIVHPSNGLVDLAEGSQARRPGRTETLCLNLGLITCKHSFEVMTIPKGLDLLIGLDLYDRLGFKIERV